MKIRQRHFARQVAIIAISICFIALASLAMVQQKLTRQLRAGQPASDRPPVVATAQ